MNPEFINGWKEIRNDYSCDWITWLGFPVIYDGGLCVNRTPEEVIESRKYMYKVKL